MKVTRQKECFCHKCGRWFHYLGIARHRAAHRTRKEDCKITYTDGTTYVHGYAQQQDTDEKGQTP